jgi:hypothetical protein
MDGGESMNIIIVTKLHRSNVKKSVGKVHVHKPVSIIFKKHAIIFKGKQVHTDYVGYPMPDIEGRYTFIRIEKDDIKSISIE